MRVGLLRHSNHDLSPPFHHVLVLRARFEFGKAALFAQRKHNRVLNYFGERLDILGVQRLKSFEVLVDLSDALLATGRIRFFEQKSLLTPLLLLQLHSLHHRCLGLLPLLSLLSLHLLLFLEFLLDGQVPYCLGSFSLVDSLRKTTG